MMFIIRMVILVQIYVRILNDIVEKVIETQQLLLSHENRLAMPPENKFYDFETKEYVFLLIGILAEIYIPLNRQRVVDID